MKSDTRRLLAALALIAATAAVVAHLDAGRRPPALLDASAPPLRLPDRRGAVIDLEALQGKVVLVNFWASWCPPCIEEMPSLQRLHDTLGSAGVVVLAVSVDEEDAAIAPVLSRFGITFTVVHDRDGASAAAYGVTSFPESFVIDRAGVVRRRYAGAVAWEDPAVLDHLRGLLRR